jgi:hypothetical protein
MGNHGWPLWTYRRWWLWCYRSAAGGYCLILAGRWFHVERIR